LEHGKTGALCLQFAKHDPSGEKRGFRSPLGYAEEEQNDAELNNFMESFWASFGSIAEISDNVKNLAQDNGETCLESGDST
jgi:hypothetical protein